ncbi:MAG: 50S ribosomal protein L20 [Candidatus Sungbacteria bacterium RIFCSPLOWO2_02_FULL_51_17]|uniref:Large ribosomal subunit protein bL20 n=1 Tax=Candidatus Sungbacteria bacterium RIFCSPHIGHO2_02_FULL_51_29 TaxID=1802273 RepID=A0A1G2KRK2_9BACT|nr:MAG: 50S ribosomal protein L20 [Candidatus Sungbacteria bacterium RIFCSPHIGHO2_01_FULL_51_22]OHA01983.1 MAG: 50S ribosomal protein L20 [Candidatus Sungbacteria bacterium RIFCSPHIGHO2_02_FULL_51_29]OHA06507.1 MAG: 50S ribosomal protein L20 [Candidatus Sungbacteria bacterium RIFCSPLOWO2_01_FULL_51_34]OHA11169.1 MAG: 50S ribosomal protein L20 [Candidatus Sungbacteria bacterium RIFCSPLOWO2_02_FULL_51_17]
MTRVKRGTIAHKHREKLLKHAKGFRWGRKSKERAAKEALLHAWSNMFAGRKRKKREFRTLWQIKISAAARENGTSYSKLINALKKKHIELDRKILAELAEFHPDTFKKVLEATQ